MLISEIIPYERNARHNERAIPKVAESIEEFGLRGTIGLESPENPVIVFGHTRVAACKLLGWTEIPDSKIEYCDDLSAEQIKAFRIADNKTGDIATYNKSMLREEVRSLKDFDMTRFGLDFKSKKLEYGAERLKTDRAYNLDAINRDCCGRDGFPPLPSVDVEVPYDLQGFNYAKTTGAADKAILGCHFFIEITNSSVSGSARRITRTRSSRTDACSRPISACTWTCPTPCSSGTDIAARRSDGTGRSTG